MVLRFRQWGGQDAPTVLMWPGGTRSAPYHFDEIAPQLAAFGPRVLAVHPPGWSSTPLPHDGYRPTALAASVVSLLDILEIKRVAFVGYSWGAFVGCHLAALAPRRLAALALLDAGYSDFADSPEFVARSLSEHVVEMRSVWPTYPSWQAVEQKIRDQRPALRQRMLAGLREVDGQIVPIVPYEVLAAQLIGVQAEPVHPTYAALAALTVPILAVAATNTIAEEWRAAGLARFQSQVPAADVHVVDSSHDLFGEKPALMVQLLSAWATRARWF